MRSQPLPVPQCASAAVPSLAEPQDGAARIGSAVAAVRDELAACSAQNIDAVRDDVRGAVRGLARALMELNRANHREPWVGEVLDFIRAIGEVGGHDAPVDEDDLAAAQNNLSRGWVGLLAAMLQVPAWQLRQTPSFAAVPNWLWGDYAAWIFAQPLRFSTPDTDRVHACLAQRVQDLERWAARNAGSAAIRAAVMAYLKAGKGAYDRGDPSHWRIQAEARGRLLTRTHMHLRETYQPAIVPRHGRRLRVGVIARDFNAGPELFAVLPSFEQLDPKSFDLFLFPLVASESAEAAYCSRRARATQVLATTTAERVGLLRNAQLDVAIFVGDVGRDWNDVTELALHRLAALQVAVEQGGFTTGLPEIDLFVSARDISPEQATAAFTERVGILRGPPCSYGFAGADVAAAPTSVTREELGLPTARSLIATLIEPANASTALLQSWADVLAASGGAHLAIAFADAAADATLTRFASAVDRALRRAGVDPARATIFTTSPRRPEEARILISLADVFLDSPSSELAGWATAEALRAAVPVITGGRQTAATMLALIGASELVSNDAAMTVAAILNDPDRRAGVRTQIQHAIEATPEFFDSLAASDAFGALIEAAFDELASLGRAEFRRQVEPVRCFTVEEPAESVAAGLAAHTRGEIETAALEASLALRSAPADLHARHLHGLVLHAQGNAARAVDYLVAAVQRPQATAAMWYALALALRDNGQFGEAIQVLETCLRLDPRNVDALLTLLELAERVGGTEIARDVLQCLQEVAPEDPRVVAMS